MNKMAAVVPALHKEDVVVQIHDDYCNHVGTAEISQILLKISTLISNLYRNIIQETGEF